MSNDHNKDTVRLHTNSTEEGKEPTVSIGFAPRPMATRRPLLLTWTLTRQMMIIGVVLVASVSFVGLMAAVISLKVQLHQVSTNLSLMESKAPSTYQSLVSNLTSTFQDRKVYFNTEASVKNSLYSQIKGS